MKVSDSQVLVEWMIPCLMSICLVKLLFPMAGEAAKPPASRYFYSGNGKINLTNEKGGASFSGRYRTSDGKYDEKALRSIHEVFGAHYGDPVSAVSIRLIEFLDFIADHFRPDPQITIASGWRSPEYNTNLRDKGHLAAKASLHQYGMAADIEMEGIDARRIWKYIKKLKLGGAGYYHGKLVHVDVGPARSWDEKTSGVGTDISDHNKLIGIVTDKDIYLPGERVVIRFIRMTAFPIGVSPEFVLERVGEGACEKISFMPAFPSSPGMECPHFSGIEQMLGISWELPGDIRPGRYRISTSFCEREWEDMPADTISPEFEVLNP